MAELVETFPRVTPVFLSKKWMIVLPIGILGFSFSIHAIDFMGQKKALFVRQPSYVIPKPPPATQFETDSGLKVWIPENGGKCDDSPLPCTQNIAPNLSLLKDEDFSSGFIKFTSITK